MNNLNREQKCIVYNVLGRMLKNEKFNIFLSGGSGVGKSRALHAVYQTICRKFNNKEDPVSNIVVTGAYTGKAAFNVGGLTLHTIFHLPTKQTGQITPLASAILTKCKKNFAFTLLFIIDEISMVGLRVFSWILKRVNQITEVKESGKLNVSFLVVGDFAQLKPVQDNWIFRGTGLSNPIANILGNTNWRKFQLFELTEIMRQRDDKIFAETLRTIGELGVEFCTPEQINLLNSRIIRKKEPLQEIPQDTIILTHSNQSVRKFNEQRIEASGGNVVINLATNFATGPDCKKEIANAMVSRASNLSRDQTGNLSQKLLLLIGRKYLITSNLSTSDGLAHGTVGVLKSIIFHKQARQNETLVKRVYLKFEDPLIGRQSRSKNIHTKEDRVREDWTLIECSDVTLNVHQKGDFQIHRVQLPLVECEAMTIHKSQGQTYSSVAVNIGDNLTQSLMYVALSRATSLDGLYLFGAESILKKKLTRNSLKALRDARTTTAPKIEMNRMRNESLMENLYPFMMGTI